MDDDGYEHAIIADTAYQFYEHGAAHAQNELNAYMDGYTLDSEYSNDHAVTVLRPDGTAIIGYRGTDPWNVYDLGADALVISGYHREKSSTLPYTRFQRAIDHHDRVTNKYEVSSLTGHSLGGSVSDYVGRQRGVKAYAFNPGESPFEYARFGMMEPSETTVYTTGDDPISISSYAYRNKQRLTVVPKTVHGGYYYVDTHDRRNFLPSKKQGAQPLTPFKVEDSQQRESRLCRIYPERCPKGD